MILGMMKGSSQSKVFPVKPNFTQEVRDVSLRADSTTAGAGFGCSAVNARADYFYEAQYEGLVDWKHFLIISDNVECKKAWETRARMMMPRQCRAQMITITAFFSFSFCTPLDTQSRSIQVPSFTTGDRDATSDSTQIEELGMAMSTLLSSDDSSVITTITTKPGSLL